MIRPSEVDVSKHFWDSGFQNSQRETVARNITMLDQALAFDRDDDRWLPFTMDDYETFRATTSREPVGYKERSVMNSLVNEGYLDANEAGQLTVTDKFLGIVVQFVSPEISERFIAR